MVGDLEKGPQSPVSPTNTDDTLRGDVIIEVPEERDSSNMRPSSESSASAVETSTQPGRHP
jgi:hypothetical protein